MSESDKEKQKKYYPLPELAKTARIKSMEEYYLFDLTFNPLEKILSSIVS